MSDAGSDPSPPRRRRAGLIIGGVAAAVLLFAGGVGAFVLLRHANSPEAALDAYLDANAAGDFEAMLAAICEQARNFYEEKKIEPATTAETVGVTWEIGDVEEFDENSVAVTVSFQFEEHGQYSHRYLMLRKDGAWKACGRAPDQT